MDGGAGGGALPGKPDLPVSLAIRMAVGAVAFLAGYAVGMGWVFAWGAVASQGHDEGYGILPAVALFLAGAAPALAVATVRWVARLGLRAGSGVAGREAGGSAPPEPMPAV